MKKMVLAILVAVLVGRAQDTSAQSDFEKFKKEQSAGLKNEDASFQRYKAEVSAQYDSYLAEQERLLKEYTGQIEKKWGVKKVSVSTKKEYVAYNASYTSRSKIDFEKGVVKVELLLSADEAKNKKLVEQKLKEQVAQAVLSKGGTDPLEVKENIPGEEKPLVADQVQTKDGKPVTESTAQQFAEQVVKSDVVTQEVVAGKDDVKRVVIGVQIPLVPSHIKKRAADFKEDIQKDANKFGVDATLVFAVMHTESYFNPMARSSVPAFGLMQLVPKSGARDAYFFVYHQDTLVTAEYLFIPNNNIELGAGYLAKLLTVDFQGVKDPKSKIYCAIAAYNTGPGNVAKAFVGKRNIMQALPKINSMTPDDVLEFLKKNLPFEETRQYVGTVSGRMGLYNEWAGKD